MNAFHVCGVLFAAWAVVISVLGIRSESFPSGGSARLVGLVSVVLCIATIGTAIYTSATEEEEHEGEEETALLLRI